MMTHPVIYKNVKTGIWSKCAATATKLKNIMVKPHETKCAHEKFYSNMADYAKYLRTFG